MKWSPQPKGTCARPDCDKDAVQGPYCMNHYHLWRRNGTPYRQDEIAEMDDRNKYTREMDELLDANPPVITWRFCPVRKVQVAVWIEDPHTDHAGRHPQLARTDV